jgi:hypothetical protein
MNAIPLHICRALPPTLNRYPRAAINKIYKRTVTVYKNKNQRINFGDDLNMTNIFTLNLGHFLDIKNLLFSR